MEEYNPLKTINTEDWLNLSEGERIEMVRDYHMNIPNEIDEEALEAHSVLHVVVENQLAEKVELLPETIAKLLRQGLDRHEAIHAIAAILAEDIFDMLHNKKKFSAKKYRRKLEKITAKRWRKGQY